MLIAIDASKLTTDKPTGVELYCREIIFGLAKKSVELVFYTPRLITELPRQNQKILYWPFKFWSQIRLALELIINPPDIFFTPGYVIPFLALFTKRTRKIVTIHDVAFVYFPESYSFFSRLFLKLTTREAVQYAHKIIVPTQTTKDDLLKHFNCPESKIVVTYFSLNLSRVSKETRDPEDNSSHHGIPRLLGQARNKIQKKQILYLGRLEAKKNIDNLIDSFLIFNEKYPDYKLILAGKPGYGFNNVKYQISNVKCLGYVSDLQKEQLLQESSSLVLISHYEGFGFPLLEAFAHNLPVLASDIPALKEIGQNACLFVDPDSPKAIAASLDKICNDLTLRQELITAGEKRLADFSWEKCIDVTWGIIRNHPPVTPRG